MVTNGPRQLQTHILLPAQQPQLTACVCVCVGVCVCVCVCISPSKPHPCLGRLGSCCSAARSHIILIKPSRGSVQKQEGGDVGCQVDSYQIHKGVPSRRSSSSEGPEVRPLTDVTAGNREGRTHFVFRPKGRNWWLPGWRILKAFERLSRGKGAWLAQSVEHVTLNLRVASSSPAMGVEIT